MNEDFNPWKYAKGVLDPERLKNNPYIHPPKDKGQDEPDKKDEVTGDSDSNKAAITCIKTPGELKAITGNYSLAKGKYEIDFDIQVPQGSSLVLEAGVELYFTKDAGITCKGGFEAKGREGLEVLLTAKDENEGWKNLYLKGSAEAIVDYARFSYGRGRENIFGSISGGAVLLEIEDGLKPNLITNNSCFENNSATGGGAIYNWKGNVEIKENNRFENNSAKLGGAIRNYNGTVEVKENNIFENNSAQWGGAIYNWEGTVEIKEKNRFENNSAKYGGAIRNYNGKLSIDKSKNVFIGNTPDDIREE